MSGHSKWATIKHDKGINDAKRGKIFSKLSKAISIAVREGGGDNPEFNPKLRLMIEKAKASNMPKENVQRAIDKGAGRIEGMNYQEVTYEGFGPNKIAMMINCVTDNTNRTNSEIKSLFDKNGGVLGSQGSTAYFFDKKGLIDIALPSGNNQEEVELQLIDFGAEDFQVIDANHMQVIVEVTQTHQIASKIKEAGYAVEDAEVVMIPNTTIALSPADFEKFNRFLDIIDDHDDVQRIFHNGIQS